MTGREKIEAAFSPKGTPEIPVVIPYEDVYIRDHWHQLTSAPWWHDRVPDIEAQVAWRREAIEKTGQDWHTLGGFYSRDEREHIRVEERSEGVFQLDLHTGREWRLEEPQVGGWSGSAEVESFHPVHLPETRDEIDELVPSPPALDERAFRESGRGDLASRMLEESPDLFPICRVSSPLWCCYGIWGFEGMMAMVATDPDLVRYACERYLQHGIRAVRESALLGAAGVWIEECLTDMISPQAFASLNVPLITRLAEEVRAAGMRSIHYFCGNPHGKLDLLLSTGADALSLEEGKKGFEIDIAEVAERVRGRCVLLGNLDAVGVLQNGSDEQLRAEIARQIAAGRANGGRFIMSLGSPVTPDTPIERVRLYCDLAHEIGYPQYGRHL